MGALSGSGVCGLTPPPGLSSGLHAKCGRILRGYPPTGGGELVASPVIRPDARQRPQQGGFADAARAVEQQPAGDADVEVKSADERPAVGGGKAQVFRAQRVAAAFGCFGRGQLFEGFLEAGEALHHRRPDDELFIDVEKPAEAVSCTRAKAARVCMMSPKLSFFARYIGRVAKMGMKMLMRT